MNGRTSTTLTTMARLCLAISLPIGSAVAQQKQQVSFKVPAENIKYGLQQNVVVGDVPNHVAFALSAARAPIAATPQRRPEA